MRIVHVHYDGAPIGGASIAMLRLHAALRKAGHESLILCRTEAKDPHATAVPVPLVPYLVLMAQRGFVKLISGVGDSTTMTPTGMACAINRLRPDAVILHWIQADTISVSELPKIEAPVYWYHHDLWPIRGVTAYEWFRVRPHQGWLDKVVRWNKRRVARLMGSRLVPVCASDWVSREIQASGMYSLKPRIVPLPLDDVFCEGARTPSRKFRILNGARGGFDAGIKGGDRLLKAIGLLPEEVRHDMEMVVFGESRPAEVKEDVPVAYVGRVFGEALAQLYRDADVFAFPSRQETFGQTKIEALACGTPVVAFDETACAEGLVHRLNGWVAPPDDIRSFAEGLLYFYQAWKSENPIRVKAGGSGYTGSAVVAALMNAFSQNEW